MRTVVSQHGVENAGALRLRGAQLWLDGQARGEIAWLGRLGAPVRRRGRVVCSEALASALGPGAGRPLALPFRQPWRLGTSRLTLSMAGSGPGSSLLWVDDDQGRLLVATAARLGLFDGPEAADVPVADAIVVDAQDAEAATTSSGSVVAALAALRLKAGPDGGWVGVDDVATALWVARLALAHGPVRFEGGLGAVIKRLPPSWLARSERASARRRDLVHLCGTRRLAQLPAGTTALQIGADAIGSAWPHLPLPWRPGLAELEEIVRRSEARTVIVIGDGASALAARLEPAGLDVVALVGQRQLALW